MYTIVGSKVYHYDVEVAGANPATFVALNSTWGKDDRKVFCRSRVKRVADHATFEALNECYARDKLHVYTPALDVRVDRASFTVLDAGVTPLGGNVMLGAGVHHIGGYAKDKNLVYFVNKVVKAANPASFVSLRTRFGLDSENVFYEGNSLHVKDIASWRPLTGTLSCDRFAVYRYNKVVEDADPRTLWLLPPLEEDCFRDHAAFYCTNFPGPAKAYYESFEARIGHYTNLLRLFKKGDYFSTQFQRSVPMDVTISDAGPKA